MFPDHSVVVTGLPAGWNFVTMSGEDSPYLVQVGRHFWADGNVGEIEDYIDSSTLRRNIQRVLNRGENYHKLRRAVSHANFGQLRFKTEHEQHLWNEYSRLITNCIIYYNITLLSHLLDHKEKVGDIQSVARLKQISPIAWQHINLHGRFEFDKGLEEIDLKAIIQELSQLPIN